MALLGQGDSLFLGPNWRVTSSRNSGEPSCIYDFPVVSFAVNNEGDKIAFLVKDDSPSAEEAKKPRRRNGGAKTPTHIIKLFGFDRSEIEVKSLLCSLPTGPARRIQWSPSGKFLFLFDTPSSHITILKLVSVGPTFELSVICDDTALAPFFYQHGATSTDEWCALINEKRQTADCWNLSKDTVVASLQLSRRSIKLVDTAVAGRIVVSLYDNLCISFAVWDSASQAFVKLPKIDDLFKDKAHSEDELARKISHKLRVSATESETEILVGLTTCKDVYRFEVQNGKATLVGMTTISDGAALVDLSGTPLSALVEFERYNFQVVPLVFEVRNVEIESKPKKEKKKKTEDEESHNVSSGETKVNVPDSAASEPLKISATQPTPVKPSKPMSMITLSVCAGVGILVLFGLKKISQRK
ncbi:transmembrane protein, putative [Bodo saltans]|uniref:Transmembrane protein, putative n=1 Tax=Bodo saltans TaxID=75058 RepID=A0A0S4IIU7_BODSA|nr:transmembrane protein, putative [Bodo saltans]|eukprot:CUE73200.1 transmembrane protein, putative [Bodo saltans]